MKYILTSFLLFIICQIGFGQTELCDAVIYWKYEGIIKIYDEPNGLELTSLQNDIENENSAALKIKEIEDNYFYVEISLAMDSMTYNGWIERSEYIGAFMKHEKEYMDLALYSKPNDKLSELIKLKNWKAGFVTIEECNEEWTKVSVDFDGKRITGWIKSEKLCANNYSSCS
ncbi:hypothetical protein F0365_13870 [Nonlabens sp. Ci31]|uniref:hypothetical protein n=1 Tax=Nonlabens sp. Ci31 TaxID=2608253 RepID=UPI001462E364|nr:hypothetical protein [Nonlabens sp. Ci31]QJP35408.1 hypothetical protein F0365_13870 [Nonlabens sp. Ci31]